ncbi:hypothetical protein L6164_032554 [Bauhinia variegata]|uniref:Uncharacterized protein n=1 Tax=Bauhinia variegata TaxID=167791 RepID=A0ACB9KP61_BAUVA|nr:hypothetical protein L6164_032554 [Bauhinia variegata]
MHAFGIFLLLLSCVLIFVSSEADFIYNGFEAGSLNLDGSSSLRQNGILTLTDSSSMILGHAFYPSPLPFKSRKTNPPFQPLAPPLCFPWFPSLPNETSVREFPTSYLAVEFDTVQNLEFEDVDDNHVGIDFSSLVSNVSKSAVYYSSNSRDDTSKNITINLKSGEPIQAWIDYNEEKKLINVTISPFGMPKPYNPLISFPVDLSTVLSDYMYAAFSASNGLLIAENNIHGWSFKVGGKAQELYKANIPLLGSSSSGEVVHRKSFVVGITLASVTLFIFVVSAAIHVLRRIGNEDEILQDWEVEYGAHRFKHSELHLATKGFGEKNMIGYGGFGIVYRGVIPRTGLEVAVKRVAPDSRQGMKEFAAEITIASGRQPIEPQNARELVLVDWVRELYSQGDITRAIDPSLDEYDKDEAELVLILGLLCSHPHPDCRPSMRRIVELLLRDASLPPLPVDIHCDGLRPIMENS